MGGATTEFQFITSISLINRDDETRRKVRSHARKQKLTNEGGSSQVSGSKSQKDQTSRFKIRPTAANATAREAARRAPARVPPAKVSRGASGEQSSRKSSPGAGDAVDGDPRDSVVVSVAKELPAFPLIPIETTPMTDNLIKYCMCVCLSPYEQFVQKWFNRCGAPTYMSTYHTSFLANAFAMNPGGNWFDMVYVDPVMTHGFMATLAAMHSAFANWNDTATVDWHKFQAIKAINKRLDSEGRHLSNPVSDSVIVAVSLLVSTDALMGSHDSAAAHMSGLKKMVEMRGGLIKGFGYSTLIQRSLSWADYSYATAVQQPLVFPFVPSLADSLAVRDLTLSDSLRAPLQGLKGSSIKVDNNEVLDLLELLKTTANALNGFEFEKLRVEGLMMERWQISDSIYLAEYRLCTLEDRARLRHSPPDSGFASCDSPLSPEQVDTLSTSGGVDISSCLIYASHLFLHLAVRGQPPSARRHRAFADLLMDSLLDTHMFEQDGSYAYYRDEARKGGLATDHSPPHDLLLWVLFMGSCVQIPDFAIQPPSTFHSTNAVDHRAFFTTALHSYCRFLDISTEDNFIERLKSIVWLASWCDQQALMAWQRIERE